MYESTPLAEFLSTLQTHEVKNQPLWQSYSLYQSDCVIQFWLKKFNGNWAEKKLHELGVFYGYQGTEYGELANRYSPEFVSHDRNGNRIDRVDFHPSYHQLMQYGG
ncbi:hypothetical protein [Parashewanella hymeniacidonis]|uniref:hypothetical protein n=1 Tax=Parashewanella hymeniacidonis TaxID=2807618 RepID=UPI0023E8EBD5|nr:hypothetical protein [Parashewanella hymeniacidonis]